MDDQAILKMLKQDLELTSSIADEYLQNLISAAKSNIRIEGIALPESSYDADDAHLIVMQAAYLYRNRVSNGEGYTTAALHPQGEPYMLRLAKNNKLFSQKMRTTP